MKLITFHPSHKMYKYVHSKPFTVYPSDKFEDTAARLTFEVKPEKMKVLVYYMFSGAGTERIAMRLNTNEGEIPNTLCSSTNSGFLNLFAWGVTELEQGDHDIFVSSISKGAVNVDPAANSW